MEDRYQNAAGSENRWIGRISTPAFVVLCILASAGGGFLGLIATTILYIFGVDDSQRLGAATVLFFFIGLMATPAWLIMARSRSRPSIRPKRVNSPRPATLALPAIEQLPTEAPIQTHAKESHTSMAPSTLAPTIAGQQIHGRVHYRVIDWTRALNIAVAVPFTAFMCLLVAAKSNHTTVASLSIIIGIVATVAVLYTHLRGTVINTAEDTLSFPTLFFPRSVKLSEIRDANAEFWTRSVPIGNFGDSSVKERTGTQRIYAANLSGEFGGRQIKFWSKLRRDHFLSHLREAAPHVRITMWR